MNVDVIQEEENPMLHRTDVRFEVTHEEETPSRLSVRDSLAATLNKDAEEVVVHELDTKFGMRTTVGYAKVYETPEHARDVEQDYMLQRNKIGDDGSEADAGADEAEATETEAAEAEPDEVGEVDEDRAGEAEEAEVEPDEGERGDEAEDEQGEAEEAEAESDEGERAEETEDEQGEAEEAEVEPDEDERAEETEGEAEEA